MGCDKAGHKLCEKKSADIKRRGVYMKKTWLAALAALVLATAAFAAKPKSTNSTGILGLALDAAFAKKSKLKIPSYLEVRQEGRDVVVFANGEETLPEDLVIPEGVTAIGDSAFYGCASLVSVTIPEGVTAIGGYAFNGCTSLANVTVPSSVTSIGDYAFLGCTSLTSVTIPEGVKYIGKMAFEGCSLLADVTIPESVMYILDGAFDGCTSAQGNTIRRHDGAVAGNHRKRYDKSSIHAF